jgi:hypothetical protein
VSWTLRRPLAPEIDAISASDILADILAAGRRTMPAQIVVPLITKIVSEKHLLVCPSFLQFQPVPSEYGKSRKI